MQIKRSEIEVESSGILKEESFSIENSEVIFEILRHKMYSNPIGAICREVSCNARDAHREIGKGNVPITITLPSRFDPLYKIKDNGPGITPERMSKVFVKYAASTKRADNIQTGGFGLGAKTPFAYSDTFNIISITDGVKRVYTALIDETRIGKVMLVNEQPCNEANGTEIVVPINPKDNQEFKRWTYESTKHWDVKPNILGDRIEYPTFNKKTVVSGKDWFLSNADSNYGHHTSYYKAIIDGIEYPIDIAVITDKEWLKQGQLFHGQYSMYITFPIGLLSLSASREQLEMNADTQKEIVKRLLVIREEMAAQAQKKVDLAPDYRAANKAYAEIEQTLKGSYVQLLNWKGKKLYGVQIRTSNIEIYDMRVGCEVDATTKSLGFTITDSNGYSRPRRRYLYGHQNLNLIEEKPMFINDTGTPFKTMKDAMMLKFIERYFPMPTSDKTRIDIQVVECANVELALKTYPFDELGYRLLSDFIKPKKVVTKTYNGRLDYYQFDKANGDFGRSSKEVFDKDDAPIKIAVLLHKDKTGVQGLHALNEFNEAIPFKCFKSIVDPGKVSVYGFHATAPKERLEYVMNGCVPVQEHAKTIIKNSGLTQDDIREIIAHNAQKTYYVTSCGSDASLFSAVKHLKRQDGVFGQYFCEQVRLNNLHVKHNDLLEIVGNILPVVKDKDTKYESAVNKVKATYPLLKTTNTGTSFKDIAEYVNFKDEAMLASAAASTVPTTTVSP